MPPRPAVTTMLVLAFLVGGCGPGSGPSASPSASSAAVECPTSPDPDPAKIPEWTGAGQTLELFPQIINPSGTLACGASRLTFSLLDSKNTPMARPDRTVEVALYDLGKDPATAVVMGKATFLWSIEPTAGVYVFDADFPTAGVWGAQLTTTAAGGTPEVIRVGFDVQPTSSVVRIGDAAPSVETPTLAGVGGDVAKISTDPHPVAAFYETSIADAIAAKEPFVVAFATPKFCVSRSCGPTLDRLKPIAAKHPKVTVINVEPYELEDSGGQLQPVLTNDALTPVEATTKWGLAAEPWVFVVDKDGIVTASFMLIYGDEELDAAMAAVESPG